ncbi:MAG: 3-dehydroquinate synthase [Gemmatimonadales bacterium]
MRSTIVPVHDSRDASYEVFVARGALQELPRLLNDHCPAPRYAVISDDRVAELHGATMREVLVNSGIAAIRQSFPAGEWNKSREQWGRLTDELLAAKLGRDGVIVAFGGGVTGDLAGFVAATYLRGIPYVQVPTTLLAMIDASIGGKTGVDVPAGKNLVGAFHQPRFVLADIDLLATLPKPQVASGMAEAIKHGAIRDAAYFESLEDAGPVLARDLDRLAAIVRGSISIKASVVAADEREAGQRQVLNFGHTVGHAVESLSGFELLHGEAVAIGMSVEARIAESAGVATSGVHESLVRMLERYALPTALPKGLSTDALFEAMSTDKKVRDGKIRLALPRAIGKVARSDDGAWTVEVEERVIRQVLDSAR